jgi:hypothetical protein
MRVNEIRELTDAEMSEVTGGFLAGVIALGLGFIVGTKIAQSKPVEAICPMFTGICVPVPHT